MSSAVLFFKYVGYFLSFSPPRISLQIMYIYRSYLTFASFIRRRVSSFAKTEVFGMIDDFLPLTRALSECLDFDVQQFRSQLRLKSD